jgi:hypothetical protein
MLNYRICRETGEGEYRFIGGFESVTGDTLWIRSDTLTIPVVLSGAGTYLLPMQEGGGLSESYEPGEETPERIRWDRVSSLTEGAKVFVGGCLRVHDGRLSFVSAKEQPLLVIFYDGADRSLTGRAIRAGRHKNEYWNTITPYAFIIGALSEILIAASFLNRPAFRLTVITSFIAVFTPLFPLIPPGVLFTVLYHRFWRRARVCRAYRDLARLPLRYLPSGEGSSLLPDGEKYSMVCKESLSAEELERIPLLIPPEEKRKGDRWYIYGVLGEGTEGEVAVPDDPFATYGALPGKPEVLIRRFKNRAYMLEVIAWILLLTGISLNIFFIRMIIFLL